MKETSSSDGGQAEGLNERSLGLLVFSSQPGGAAASDQLGLLQLPARPAARNAEAGAAQEVLGVLLGTAEERSKRKPSIKQDKKVVRC